MANKKVKTVYKFKWKNFAKLFLVLVAFVGVLFAGFWGINFYKDYKATDSIIKKVHETVEVTNIVDDELTKTIPPDSTLSKFDIYWDYIKLGLLDVDMASLMKINADTVGYIDVKGTDFNYPVVKDNDGFYKKHSFDKLENANGWIYIDDKVSFEELGTNTIIYGNKLFLGKLFKDLDNVFKQTWNENDDNFIIRYYTNYHSTLWQIVSVFNTSDKTVRKTNFDSEKDLVEYIDNMIKKSEVKFKTKANVNDRFLTLTTNSNGENIVIFAKLIKIKTLN